MNPAVNLPSVEASPDLPPALLEFLEQAGVAGRNKVCWNGKMVPET